MALDGPHVRHIDSTECRDEATADRPFNSSLEINPIELDVIVVRICKRLIDMVQDVPCTHKAVGVAMPHQLRRMTEEV